MNAVEKKAKSEGATALIHVAVKGTRPLMMNNVASDLPDAAAMQETIREINAKKKTSRTLEDEAERDRLKYLLALYWDEDVGPYLPGYNLWAAVREAATVHRLKTAWIRGGLVIEDKLKLEYSGPRTPDELYRDPRFVDRRQAKPPGQGLITVARPIFREWRTKATFLVNDSAISVQDARRAIQLSGELTGLGTFRQRFGRYDITFEHEAEPS